MQIYIMALLKRKRAEMRFARVCSFVLVIHICGVLFGCRCVVRPSI